MKYVDPDRKRLIDIIDLHTKPNDKRNKSVANRTGDNVYVVQAHGTPTALFAAEGRLGSPEKINNILSQRSTEWKEAMNEGDKVVLVLLS